MLVKAKCVTPCWDSGNAVRYEPGNGPLPEGLYEIDRDGPLASLKLGSTYVFAFDRNANPDDKPHDYSCKREGCGKKFKTLAALGSHVHSDHGNEETVLAEPEEETEDLSERTCFVCIPPKVLRTRHGLRLHDMKSHPFREQPQVESGTAVPA